MGALRNPEPPRTALVLDDEVQIGAFVCTALSALGLAVRHFTDPLQFLLEVQRAAPDILMLDLALGRADAIDVIRKLEFLKFAGRVLLISGRDQATLHEFERIGRARGLQMMQSLQKPFPPSRIKSGNTGAAVAGRGCLGKRAAGGRSARGRSSPHSRTGPAMRMAESLVPA